jgi:hypothetical protein
VRHNWQHSHKNKKEKKKRAKREPLDSSLIELKLHLTGSFGDASVGWASWSLAIFCPKHHIEKRSQGLTKLIPSPRLCVSRDPTPLSRVICLSAFFFFDEEFLKRFDLCFFRSLMFGFILNHHHHSKTPIHIAKFSFVKKLSSKLLLHSCCYRC